MTVTSKKWRPDVKGNCISYAKIVFKRCINALNKIEKGKLLVLYKGSKKLRLVEKRPGDLKAYQNPMFIVNYV